MTTDTERLRRWRLVLGEQSDDSSTSLSDADKAMDRALAALYEPSGQNSLQDRRDSKRGGYGGSAPAVARWLGDIRGYFPVSVVQVMQKDALERLNLQQMLLEPEMLEAVTPDVELAATLIALNKVIPERTRETARLVVRKVLDELLARLELPMQQAIRGSLNRAQRNRRPRHNEIDWARTIRKNLRHYQPDYQSIIPQQLVGFGRKQTRSMQDIILCVDQSGSMATSVVYSSVFGAVMASLPAVTTHMIVFDTAVADLTAELTDPVDLLFGAQLGGGTDINRAVGYCQSLIRRPQETVLVLITDLYEGGDEKELLKRMAELTAAGVQVITLLSLNDEGASFFDSHMAQKFVGLDIPCFACTPDQFPDLMAAALNRSDLQQWAAAQGIVTARAG